MDWQSKIPSCFAPPHAIFAGHEWTRPFTKALIQEAKKAGATQAEFEAELAAFVVAQVENPEIRRMRLAYQATELAKLWNRPPEKRKPTR